MLLKSLSIRARLTAISTAVLTLIILTISCGMYFFIRQSLMHQLDNHIRKDINTITRVLLDDRRGLELIIAHSSIHLFHISKEGGTVASSREWDARWLDRGVKGPPRPIPWSWTDAEGGRFRLASEILETPDGRYRVDVGHDEGSVRSALRTLELIMLLGFPVAMVAAVAGGYFLVGRLLAPISAMTRKAKEITADRLSERLPVENPEDEIGRLAQVFNETFTRLDDAFTRLQRFAADASHELRTPLTAIRSIGEAALQQKPGDAEWREVVSSILEEADRLVQTVESFLLLSRAESGSPAAVREPVYLAELAGEVVEFLSVLAEEKEQRIILSCQGGVNPRVNVDRGLLRQALVNLLDNAIKYTPVGGRITVLVGKNETGKGTLEIMDSGPGIAQEHQDRIFDRFYRVDRGRSRESGGTGLGLSIARWAVEVNDGRIEVGNAPGGGSIFRLIFPAATA